ncbi:MAG TPA: DUF4012 domain-containing protein [Candidatus Moranbacteria bacterium]|nr:DUF4012 domain-containing protein [Candidatus Moranbacteria bacterium]
MGEKKEFITPQMFDVRPVDSSGVLDMEKMRRIKKVVRIKPRRYFSGTSSKIGDVFHDIKKPEVIDQETRRFQKIIAEEKEKRKKEERLKYIPRIPIAAEDLDNVKNISVEFTGEMREAEKEEELTSPVFTQDISEPSPHIQEKSEKWDEIFPANSYWQSEESEDEDEDEDEYASDQKTDGFLENYSVFQGLKQRLDFKKNILSFASLAAVLLLIIFSLDILGQGLKIKNTAFQSGQEAYANLMEAKSGLSNRDFQKASLEFSQAEENFSQISNDVNAIGSIVVESSKYLPFVSKISSGAHLAKAGKDISQIGMKISEILSLINKVNNPLSGENADTISFLQIFQETDKNLKEVSLLMEDLEKNLEDVDMADIPENQREKFIELRDKLPQINDSLSQFVGESKIFTDVLGGNGPRKYLFLFQNNQEMRATGGFIGTYGILDIFNGRVRKFFVDGIFNPDGQLREKVIPPTPVQKISAAWSLHDSNWFPDFPKSAEKAAWFYEKTGGPTVDGIITMTPTVMQKLLEVTGPIEMPEYDVTVDKDNFIEKIQYEVEVDYDKELNQPKKILADLAPKILDQIFNAKDFSDTAKVMKILIDSLNEKHILIYSMNYDIEKMISARGWSGEVLDTQKDYLSVINTNINGYKTDGIIEEKIEHQAEIQNDGSIIDTITVTRHHNGGNNQFEWWNKVNSDYMRVYVPKGSTLISASGQTREFVSPPLDYRALGFKKDPQVEMEEGVMKIDEESGTAIYEDSGKTVFANWVYVSPQETVEVKYSYKLPFTIETDSKTKPADTFSVLFQKQSGSIGSQLLSKIIYPDSYNIIWKHPAEKITGANLAEGKNEIKMESVLNTDKFIGLALTKK